MRPHDKLKRRAFGPNAAARAKPYDRRNPWDRLNAEIERTGGPKRFETNWGDQFDPIDQFVNLKIPRDDWVDLMIRYFPRMELDSEQDMIVRSLIGVKSAVAREKAAKFFLSLFKARPSTSRSLLWVAGEGL